MYRCDICGKEFESTMDACPRCGKPIADQEDGSTSEVAELETRVTNRLRAIVPEDSDVAYQMAIAFALGYAITVIIGVVLTNISLFTVGVLLLFGSLVSMYLDLLNLETRLYDVRPILWMVGAILMYFLVFPLYVYKRQRVVG